MTTPIEYHCFQLTGGNYCFPAGSPNALSAAEEQAILFPNLGTTPFRTYWDAPPTTMTVPENYECFNTPGGNYCFPAGSESAISAASEYVRIDSGVWVTTTVPVSLIEPPLPSTATPPTTEPLVGHVSAPAERLADDAHSQPAPEAPASTHTAPALVDDAHFQPAPATLVFTHTAPAHPTATALPATGLEVSVLAGVALAAVLAGVAIMRVARRKR